MTNSQAIFGGLFTQILANMGPVGGQVADSQ